jgi:hypothetical protein
MIKNPKFGQLVYFSFQDKIVAGHIVGYHLADNKCLVKVGDYARYFVLQEKLFAKKCRCKQEMISNFIKERNDLEVEKEGIKEKLYSLFY